MTDKTALLEFTQRWLAQFTEAPYSESLHAIPSPCIVENSQQSTTKRPQLAVAWRPVLMVPAKNLNIVEQVMAITLHPSAHVFYGTQYAGDINVTFKGTADEHPLPVSLIQIWNDDDFSRLEQNLIAHLSMQKKFNRVPTVFIATTAEDSDIISLNNQSGEIVKESLITGELLTLAPNLTTFLKQLY
ncbi:SecY-interacting protein [Orbaceae bacterium ESL0727]|nr:SecY-interacting protein [Orbaceae bacterium ESL0727]